MSFLASPMPFSKKACLCGAAMLLFAGMALSQPSQKPLVNRDGGGVKPNLVVTLDTSASMDFQHAPEYAFTLQTSSTGKTTVTFPNFSFYWMHPYDPGPGYYDGTFKGIVPANPYRGTTGDSMLFQMQMRSPDLNTIYYNPELRYDPWIKVDGTRMPAAPAAAAPYIPLLPTLTRSDGRSPTANLSTATVAVPANATVSGLATGKDTSATLSKTVNWCGKYTASSNSPTCTTTAETYYPMIYYRLRKNASGYYEDPTQITSYSFVDINAMKAGYKKKTTGAADWQKTASDTSTGTETLTSFPKYPARTDCTSSPTSCSQAEERQNYANWFTYYRSRMLLAQGAIPEAFKDIGDTLRLGWGRIHKSTATNVDGVATKIVDSGVRDFSAVTTTFSTSSTRAKFINWLRNHPGNTDTDPATDFTTQGGTPLIEAVTGVGEYYKRTDNGGPWSDNPATGSSAAHKTCRRSYNMLVTDGYYSNSSPGVGNVDATNGVKITTPTEYQYLPVAPYKDSNSNSLADVAMKYWVEDLRPGLDNKVVPTTSDPAYWQHMTNYMIGLGVNGILNRDTDWAGLKAGTTSWPATTDAGRIDDLWHAAVNSRGEYYSVKNPKELTEGIKAALGSTLERELREAGVATASTVLQDGNRKYVPFYKTGVWSGDVQAFLLDASGQAGAQQWSAEAKLPVPASRNIVTWSTDTTPASAVTFTWADMGSSNQSALSALTTIPATTKGHVVSFLRGDRSNEGDGLPFRQRRNVLGDFINSNPVLVKDAINMGYGALPSTQGGADTRYASFLTAKKARVATIFVGSNGGMLHAFKDTLGATPADDGKEVFAYVPKAVVANLSKLADKAYGTDALYHQFFVDGPLMEADAFVNAPGASTPSWRNYVLGSLGAGGRAVFALDVTDTSNLGKSTVRWEISSTTYADLGYVTAPIEVGVLPNGEWVALFGNGNFSTAGKATLFVVNLQTGAAQTLDVDATGSNGLGGVGVVRNGSGQITTLFAGDLKGNVWKFDYSGSASSRFVVSGGAAFFTAAHTDAAPQPITQAPILFDHSKGGKIVVFGTGVLATETDANSTKVQAIYGVWDKTGDTVARPMSRSLLATRSISAVSGAGGSVYYSLTGGTVDWDGGQRGWVLNLDVSSGLRVIYPSQRVSSKIALVSVIKPASTVVACESAEGSGINLLIPVEQGVNPTYPLFDVDGSGGITSSDALVSGYATGSDGIDAIVRGVPVCSGGVCKTSVSFQSSTGQRMAVLQEPDESTGARSVKDRVWRRIINPPIR